MSIATRGARGGRRRPRWIKRLRSIPPPANTPERNKCSCRLRRSTGSWGWSASTSASTDDAKPPRDRHPSRDLTDRASRDLSGRVTARSVVPGGDPPVGARREDQRKKNTECEKTLRGGAPETRRRRRHGAKLSRSTPRTRRSRSEASCRSKTGSKFERERTCERSPGPPPYRRHSSSIGSPGSSSRTDW